MKPKQIARKTALWLGVILLALLAAGWIASGRWSVFWRGNEEHLVGLMQGQIVLSVDQDDFFGDMPRGWHAEAEPIRFHWWIDWTSESTDWRGQPNAQWYLKVPIWLIALPVGLLTGLLWRFESIERKRVRAGHCSRCGYPKQEQADVTCPECGLKTE